MRESRVSTGIEINSLILISRQSGVQVEVTGEMLVKFTRVKNMINLLIIILDKSELFNII